MICLQKQPAIAVVFAILEGPALLMDRTIAQLNIEHYRKLLAKETDEIKRATLVRLLGEEEAKLKAGDDVAGKRKLEN